MLSVCCVGAAEDAFFTIVGMSSAFFWMALRASFSHVSTVSTSFLVDSAKAVLPSSKAERKVSSNERSLTAWDSTNFTFCSLDFISTPAVSFSDTPIAFNEEDILSTPWRRLLSLLLYWSEARTPSCPIWPAASTTRREASSNCSTPSRLLSTPCERPSFIRNSISTGFIGYCFNWLWKKPIMSPASSSALLLSFSFFFWST